MTTIGHVFIPLNREHDGMVPTDDDLAHFESLPIPLALCKAFLGNVMAALLNERGTTHRGQGQMHSRAHSRCHQFVTRFPKASAISAPAASGWSVAGWDLHPLESAALSRRTPLSDIGRGLRPIVRYFSLAVRSRSATP